MPLPANFLIRLKYTPAQYLLLLLVFFSLSCATNKGLQQSSPSPSSDAVTQSKPVQYSGMWLMPQVRDSVYRQLKINGIGLTPQQIYTTENPSLSQAIVKITEDGKPWGTGSFVSKNGLVLTHYQAALDVLSAASNPTRNYLKNGFYAQNRENEIRAKNYTLYIAIEQVEVTRQIKQLIPEGLSYGQKIRREQQIRRRLIAERKAGNNDLLVEIKDVWAGNKQFMFVYKVIRDVRLVHAPPGAIAANTFGQWPSHAGAYAFFRAYVAPDGSSKTYVPDNVPFKPASHLKISNKGIASGNFVLTLGFPTSTYRYESSEALNFYHSILNPVLIRSQQSILDALQYTAAQNPQKAIETIAQRESLSKGLRYYRTIQQEMDQNKIIQQKEAREKELKEWIDTDSKRDITHRKIFKQLQQSYRLASQSADLLYATFYPLNNNAYMQLAGLYHPYFEYLQHPDSLTFSAARKDSLLNQHQAILHSIDAKAQKMMLAEMIQTLATLPEGKIPFFLLDFFDPYVTDSTAKNINTFIESALQQSIIFDANKAQKFLALSTENAAGRTDIMIQFYDGLKETLAFAGNNYSKHLPYLAPAQKRYVNAMLAFNKNPVAFPDANATLRLSSGNIRGYSPTDSVSYGAFTLWADLLTTDLAEVFLDTLLPDKKPGRLPVNFLISNDVTTGSFGSAVLNAQGNLIGLTFSTNRQGIISDYLYDSSLKRTISVDIRYILFLMEDVLGAQKLADELDTNP